MALMVGTDCQIDVRKFGSIWYTIFAFAPIPITLISFLIPSGAPPTKLGTGSMNTKVAIVLVNAVLLSKCDISIICRCHLANRTMKLALGTAFRTSIPFLPTRPMTNPAWYHGRAAFYTFTPMLEILVVILLAVTRFDKRFYLDGKAEAKAREQGLDIAVAAEKDQNQSF